MRFKLTAICIYKKEGTIPSLVRGYLNSPNTIQTQRNVDYQTQVHCSDLPAVQYKQPVVFESGWSDIGLLAI